MALSDEILAFNDAQAEKVVIPEWGDLGKRLWVRVMTGCERDQWEAALVAADGDKAAFYKGVRARLAQMTACNEKGELIFTPEQVPMLTQKSSRALQRIFDVAMRINRLRKSDLEELEKNSVTEASAASGFVSAPTSENQSVSVNGALTVQSLANGLPTTP